MSRRTLVAVSAGLGRPSSTRLLADRLAQATADRLTEAGQPPEVTVVELRDLATDIAHHLVTGFPGPALRDALDAVTRADALVAVTPIFNASYSGLFKSFFDVLEETALDGTPVLIGATGGTARHSLALEHTVRPLFAYLRARVAPTAVFAAAEDWGGAGDARTEDLPRRIARAAGELAAELGALPAGGTDGTGTTAGEPADAADGVVPFAEQLAALRRDT